MTRSAKMSSVVKRSQYCRKTSASKPPGTADVVKEKTDEAKKESKNTSESGEKDSRSIVQSSFNDPLSSELPPGYTEPSPAISKVSRSSVLKYRQAVYSHELGTDDKYEHVALFLHTFCIRILHRANVFLSKCFYLFLRDIMLFYGTADTVHEQNLGTEVVTILVEGLQRNNELLALSVFAQRRTAIVRYSYIILESFADPRKHRQGCRMP